MSLRIRRTESAVSTEVLERIEGKLDALEKRDRLRELDDEWERRREALMSRGKDGSRHRPTRGGAIAFASIGIVGGTVFGVVSSSHPESEPFVLFAVFFVLFGLGGAAWAWKAADRYDAEERRYHEERAEIESGSR